MCQTVENNTPKVFFSPFKMVHDTIRVRTTDFSQSAHQPPFEVFTFEVKPGDETPKDRHPDVEIWIVLSGHGRLVYDGKECMLQAQDMVHFAPNKFHQVFNVGEESLLICSLAWVE